MKTKTTAAVEIRVEELLARMTLEEKLEQVRGKRGMRTFENKRLGIGAFSMADGPHGLRAQGRSTSFPTLVGLGATWDEGLARDMGQVLGQEAWLKGIQVVLGPCINMHRTPLGGRNFESLGEDPCLSGRLSAGYIRGMQSQEVACSVKHYAVNNQETERMQVSAEVDERTLRELYLPAFEESVKAGAWTVMAAYNKVNGRHACEHPHLLDDILRGEWGFKGLVMSDWGAVHSTEGTAWHGVDLEMPGPGYFFEKKLAQALAEGKVSEAAIDAKVRRILRVKVEMGLCGTGVSRGPRPSLKKVQDAGRKTALRIAREGIVLLKNRGGLLPLDASRMKSIAVIGPNAAAMRLGGDGSSMVNPTFGASPLQAIQKVVGPGVRVRYALGATMPGELTAVPPENLVDLRGQYFSNGDLKGKPTLVRRDAGLDFSWVEESPGKGLPVRPFSVRWTGRLKASVSGRHSLGVSSSDGSRLWLDGKLIVDHWKDHYWPEAKQVELELKAGKSYDLKLEYRLNTGEAAILRLGWLPPLDHLAEAKKLAAQCDAVIVFAGLSKYVEGEGKDRTRFDLPAGQEALIKSVSAVNPRTAVVLVNGTAVSTEGWLERVPALVEAFYPGQEGSQAMAEILFGAVNPSGRLCFTFYRSLKDSPCGPHYPGDKEFVRYREGLFTGYRNPRKEGVVFPFGHGLSYTRFSYGPLKVKVLGRGRAQAELRVSNTGRRAGKEVVQIYVGDRKSSLPRPERELKAFAKVSLNPGQSRKVSFKLEPRDFSFYDPSRGRWVLEAGEFEVMAGTSSAAILSRTKVTF